MPRINDIGEFKVNHDSALKRLSVAISSQPSGARRNVLYFAGAKERSSNGTPIQVLDQTVSNGKVNVTASTLDYTAYEYPHIVWGSDHMDVSGYNRDIFVCATSISNHGAVYFDLEGVDRNNKNILPENLLSFHEIDSSHSVAIAAGDFDNNGYRDELGVVYNTGNEVRARFYKISYSSGSLSVKQIYENLIHTGSPEYSLNYFNQADHNAFVGDFDGDGKQEFATVNRVFVYGGNEHRLSIFKYDSGNWKYGSTGLGTYGQGEGSIRATRADVDGDGKDEIVLLRLPVDGPTVYPDLEMVWCEKGSIEPKRDYDKYHKGGRGRTDLLGISYSGNHLHSYYYNNECFSITAGPLTGRSGSSRLADDIVISWVDETRKVWVIPTLGATSSNKSNFTGFGDAKLIFNEPQPMSGKYSRATVLTADFAAETLKLGSPTHQTRYKDTSYVTVFQALPYHVDTVKADGSSLYQGTWQEGPTNFTYSGFNDSNEKMQVSYEASSTKSESSNVKFVTSSTKETILALGDAGDKVLTGLKASKTIASAVGNFVPFVGKIADGLQTVMDKVTDKVQETKTELNKSSETFKIKNGFTSYERDEVTFYTSPLHIWRYPILNAALPEWFVEGKRLDYETGNITDSNAKQYITFTMYSKPMKFEGDSSTAEIYQPIHEEGNFFSYPSEVEDTEGFNSKGMLDDVHTVSWTRSISRTEEVEFSKAKETMEETDENIEKSELSDSLETLSDLLGAEALASNIPPYTSHNEKFTKSYATDEKIKVEIFGRSTLPYAAADHDLKFVPYVAKEGTMKFATAVNLRTSSGSFLWSSGSLYYDYPDPALLLPNKFYKNGTDFAANNNNFNATKLRGMRFYLPKLNKFTDSDLVNGLAYEIRVPVYNASFKNTGNFKVRLSRTTNPHVAEKDLFKAPKTQIGEVTMSLKGWDNTRSENNKGWAVFKWTPTGIARGTYYFYVEIDPDNTLKNEVHESRFAADGTVQDWGGNNVGHVLFNMHNPSDKVFNPSSLQLSKVGGGSITASNEFIVSSIHAAESSDSTIPEGKIRVTMKLQGAGDIGALYDYLESQEDPECPVPVTCEVMYEGDYVYPSVSIVGYNFEKSAAEKGYQNLEDSDIGSTFMYKNVTMFPGQPYTYTFMVRPSSLHWDDGINIELQTPSQTVAQAGSSTESESGGTISSSGSGCDLGSGSCIMLGLVYLVLKIKKGKR